MDASIAWCLFTTGAITGWYACQFAASLTVAALVAYHRRRPIPPNPRKHPCLNRCSAA